MNIVEKNVRILMRLSHLQNLPTHPLPPGYSIRYYRPGDRETWVSVQSRAEKYLAITPELHDTEFAQNQTALAQRQAFLLDPAHNPIGTATAWWDDNYLGQPFFGRLHWVALIPQFQGQGLGQSLVTAVCSRMRELGHTSAYLVTQTARLPAINLYQNLGFRPEIQTSEDATIWQELTPHLKKL